MKDKVIEDNNIIVRIRPDINILSSIEQYVHSPYLPILNIFFFSNKCSCFFESSIESLLKCIYAGFISTIECETNL